MNLHFSKKYESFQNDILKSISNFDMYGNSFNTGRRNTIKKIDIKNTTFVVKSFKKPLLINQIAYRFFRKSKAKRSYEYANFLLKSGINTPAPVAFIENFSLIGLQDSYYVSEFIDYDLTFRTLINEPNYPDHENIVKEFTEFTFELHEKKIQFLDHSPGNTLIVKKDQGYDFYLVDLNRMKFGELNYEGRLKNFARLTRKKELIKQISETYAKLMGRNSIAVLDRMLFYNQKFFKKFDTEKRLKRILLNKKY